MSSHTCFVFVRETGVHVESEPVLYAYSMMGLGVVKHCLRTGYNGSLHLAKRYGGGFVEATVYAPS